MRMYPLIILLFTLSTNFVGATEYFGRFDGRLDGEFLQGADRPLFKLNAPFKFIDPNGLEWTAPAGEVVDGASIPRFAWSIIGGPFSGNYLRAAVVHDYYCCAKTRDHHDTHKTFWRGMRLDGIDGTKAYLMWAAVKSFGPNYWTVDPNQVPPVPCDSGASVLETKSAEVRGIAATKLIAMRRTLESTGGQVIDVVEGEVILAETERANEHLEFLHHAALVDFKTPRAKLGLFSNISDDELKQLSSADTGASTRLFWDIEQVPELGEYITEEYRVITSEYINSGIEIGSIIENPFLESSGLSTLNRLDSILQ